MTDLGKMKYFLGVKIHQDSEGIKLSKKKYAKEVLQRFNTWECNLVKNPIVPGTRLEKNLEGKEVDTTMYKQLVGSLMYLMATRPDMMYVVCLASRFMAEPKEEHLHVVKRALRYLKGTLSFGLFYKRDGETMVRAYTDSDYAGDLDDRKSTSGYVCMLSDAAICWSSRKQPIVTLSSTEAEYVATTSCACHCVWANGVLSQLEHSEGEGMVILCDNCSSIKLSKNPVMHRRTKHIDVRYHYLRELVNEGLVRLEFCGSKDQLADIMTKPIKLEAFIKIRQCLGIVDLNGVN